MKRIIMILAVMVMLTACQSSEAANNGTAAPAQTEDSAQTEDFAQEAQVSYDNPIDAYFQPRMVSDYNVAESTRRGYQDTYRGVWKAEYKNLIQWLKKKCIYKEDKTEIEKMEKALQDQIEHMREVLATELLNNYKINPDSTKVKDGFSRTSNWGNGTRSRLNQIEGEMYRDAAMQIIRLAGDYSFRELDYSKENYE